MACRERAPSYRIRLYMTQLDRFFAKHDLLRNAWFIRLMKAVPGTTHVHCFPRKVNGRLRLKGLRELVQQRSDFDPSFRSLWLFRPTATGLFRVVFWDRRRFFEITTTELEARLPPCFCPRALAS